MQVKRSTESKNLKKLEKFYALQQKVVETNDLWINKIANLSNNLDNPKLKLTLTNKLRYVSEDVFRDEIAKLINFYVLESKNKKTISYITKFTNMWRSYDPTVDVLQVILHDIGIRNILLTDNTFNEISDDEPVYTEKELSIAKKQRLLENVFNELKNLYKLEKKSLRNIKTGDILFYTKNLGSGVTNKNVSLVESINDSEIVLIEQGRGSRLKKTLYKITGRTKNKLVCDDLETTVNGWMSIYDLRKQIIKHSMVSF